MNKTILELEAWSKGYCAELEGCPGYDELNKIISRAKQEESQKPKTDKEVLLQHAEELASAGIHPPGMPNSDSKCDDNDGDCCLNCWENFLTKSQKPTAPASLVEALEEVMANGFYDDDVEGRVGDEYRYVTVQDIKNALSSYRPEKPTADKGLLEELKKLIELTDVDNDAKMLAICALVPCYTPAEPRPQEQGLKEELKSAWAFLFMAKQWIELNYKPKTEMSREDKAIWLERVEKWIYRNGSLDWRKND